MLFQFIPAPTYENWFKGKKAINSILICTPFIKQKAIDYVFENVIQETCKDITILIRGTEEDFTSSRSCDTSVLDYFKNKKDFNPDKFRRVLNLHMKAYLIDDKYLLITSGNLTNRGMFLNKAQGNAEGGIATDSNAIIKDFKEYFFKIWEYGEPLNNFYDNVMEAYCNYIEKSSKDITKNNSSNYKLKNNYCYHNIKPKDTRSNALLEEKNNLIISQMPRNSKMSLIISVLETLNKYDKGLSYNELGGILRNKYGAKTVEHDKKTEVNDKKVGEEKAKTAAFLGLVIITKRKIGNICRITPIGKYYLNCSDIEKYTLIYDVLKRNEFFQLLYSDYTTEEIENIRQNRNNWRESLLIKMRDLTGMKDSTLSRITKICGNFILFYYDYINGNKINEKFLYS